MRFKDIEVGRSYARSNTYGGPDHIKVIDTRRWSRSRAGARYALSDGTERTLYGRPDAAGRSVLCVWQGNERGVEVVPLSQIAGDWEAENARYQTQLAAAAAERAAAADAFAKLAEDGKR